MRRTAALLLLLASAGCGLRLSPPPALETTPVLLPAEQLARALTHVDAQGRVDYAFGNRPTTLDLFASYLAAFMRSPIRPCARLIRRPSTAARR